MTKEEEDKINAFTKLKAEEFNKGADLLYKLLKRLPLVSPPSNGSRPSSRSTYKGDGDFETATMQAKLNSDDMEWAFKRKNQRGVGSRKMLLERELESISKLLEGSALKFKYDKSASGIASGVARQGTRKLIIETSELITKEKVAKLEIKEGEPLRGLAKLIIKDQRFTDGLKQLGAKEPTLRYIRKIIK